MRQHIFQDRRPFPILLLLVLAALAVSGCGAEAAASVPAGQADVPTAIVIPPTETAVPSKTPLPPPPTLAFTPTTAVEMPSFAAVDPVDVEKEQAAAAETAVAPTHTPAPDTPTPTPEATATETATPIPTFTPPALPFTSDDEHYWLQRPVPEGGVVWTDKVYPYGGTEGGTLRPHHGVEFNVESGTEIIAAASGTVVVAGDDSAIAYGPQTDFYGNLVIIELDSAFEGQPVYTLYGHLSQVLVSEGQHVEAEELIALSGATGVANGPHLHFEVRLGQNSYDSTRNPRLWLYPFPDYGVLAGRVVRQNGSLVENVTISLNRIDAESRYLATSSYFGNSVNADGRWQENFVLDDVPMGYYEVTVAVGSKKFTEELYVFPYRTNFVEIVIED